MKTVLFLCTGNYYRSRFAEELFNHLAQSHELNWQARSCGLAIERGTHNTGPISAHATEALSKLNIPIRGIDRMPCCCAVSDLKSADLIIALDEDEHRPLIAERFPNWEPKTVFWRVPDIELVAPSAAIPVIEKRVKALISDLDNR